MKTIYPEYKLIYVKYMKTVGVEGVELLLRCCVFWLGTDIIGFIFLNVFELVSTI